MAAQALTRVAVRLVRLLGADCAIVGGLAVNAYGYVRATKDVDLMVSVPLEVARHRLAEAGVRVSPFRGDVLEGDFPCLKGVLGGIPFDVLPPLVALERERLVLLELHGQPLPVVDFETLARLKLKAAGPKDLLDLAVLVNLRPGRRARVLELAAHDPDVQRRLASLIDDPRVKRDVAERHFEAALLAKEGAVEQRPRPRRKKPRS